MTTGKKIFTVALSVALFAALTLLVLFSLPAPVAASADGDFSYDEDVFYIRSQEDFGAFAERFNDYSRNFQGKTIYLLSDVDLAVTPFYLGNFAGTLVGFGNEIKNASSALFGSVTAQGVVKDVVFSEMDLSGCLVNGNEGRLENIAFSGAVTVRPQAGTTAYLPAAIVARNAGVITGCTSSATYSAVGTSNKNDLAGFVVNNVGTIAGCAVTGNFTLKYGAFSSVSRLSGIAIENTGTVSRCFVASEFFYEDEGNNDVLPELTAIARGGAVSDCCALYSASAYSYEKDATTYSATPLAASGDLTSVYAVRSYFDGEEKTEVVFSSGGALVAGTAADLIVENLGAAYSYGGTYPYLSDALESFGGEFLLDDRGDLFRVRYLSTCLSADYVLGDYLPEESFDHVESIGSFTLNTIGVDDVGYYGGGNFGYVENETTATLSAETPTGSGTTIDPYVVTSAGELKYLDGKTGFAVLRRSLVINRAGAGGNRLGIADLSVTLFGCGRRIVGLNDEPLTTDLTGRAESLTLFGVGGYLAERNEGSAYAVKTYETNAEVGFVRENAGYISDSLFGGSAEYAFCLDNEGTVTRCIVSGGANTVFSPTESGNYSNCIVYGTDDAADYSGVDDVLFIDNGTTTYSVVQNGEKHSLTDLDALTLLSYGFDFINGAFGYLVGEDTPSLRVYGNSYKSYYPDAFDEFTFLSSTYSPDRSYTLDELEQSIADWRIIDSVTFVWTYGGETFSGVVRDAGDYKVTATYSGSDRYLAEVFSQEFSIDKATCPEDISYDEGHFDDIVRTYDGEEYHPDEPVPDNGSELSLYGYGAPEFSLTKNGLAVTAARSAGEYAHTVTLSAKNYFDLTLSREIVIQKAVLYVKVGDADCDYLDLADLAGTATTVLSGLVPSDAGKTLSSLSGYAGAFSTDYTPGEDVGEYDIDLVVTATDYEFSVTPGVLTVHAVPLPTDGISFYGATALEKGAVAVDYSGEEIVLVAEYPEGVSVEYANNGNVHAGVYDVTATFRKANYIDLVLTATLTVGRARLSVRLPDGSSDYGAKWSLSSPPVVTGFLTEDVVPDDFVLVLKKEGVVVATTGTERLDAGRYAVACDTESTLSDYDYDYIEGEYVVKKIALTALYDGSDFVDVDIDYDGYAVNNDIVYFEENGYPVDLVCTVKKDGVPFNEGIINAGAYFVTVTATPRGDLAENYAETEYTRNVVIRKITPVLRFDSRSYAFTYDGSDHALKLFSYTTSARGEGTIRCEKEGETVPAIHAGTYRLVLSYAGSENEESCSDAVPLVVEKRSVALSFEDEYVYTRSQIVPILLSVSGTAEGETLSASDLAFAYCNHAGNSLNRVVNASDTPYRFTVSILNGDYEPIEDEFEMTVKKKKVDVAFGTVEYLYGTLGEVIFDGVNYVINETGFGRRAYPIDENVFETVQVRLPSRDSGRYELTDENVVDQTNYDFSLVGENVAVVSPRTLTVQWTFDSVVIPTPYAVEYSGASLNSRFGYLLTNFAGDDRQEDLHIEVRVSGQDADVFHAGEYLYALRLVDNVNYLLGATRLNIIVDKAPLSVSVGDATVERGENFVAPSVTVSGAVGADRTVHYSQYKGASLTYVHSYTGSAPVNTVFPVTVDARFDDYIAEVVRTGYLTVVANPYPDYALTDAVYSYDGSYKTLTIEGVDPAVRVSYNNNVQKDVGAYIVSATVTYPSGRTRISTARLTIVKATPILSMDVIEVVYAEGKLLSDDRIKGRATVGEHTVEGTFSFAEEYLVESGERVYPCVFTPTDGNNYNVASAEVTVKCEEIDFSVFSFDPLEKFSLFSVEDGVCKMTVSGTVDATLNPVLSGLELTLNGYVVPYVRLSGDSRMTVGVRLDGETILSYVFEVSSSGEGSVVVFDDSVLSFGGATRKNGTLSVPDGGTRITLAENMKVEYNLYVDGLLCEEYVLSGNEGSISVSVRKKSDNKAVFARSYTVTKSVVAEEKQVSYAMYFGIGGGVLGLAAVVAIVLIVWKKKHE